MSITSSVFDTTMLWRTTLASRPKGTDAHEEERDRLRTTFLSFRERCGHLANEIRKDLPDLTVHDLSHLDALWETSSTIVGEGYSLTPTEAFVLGGAILLHDLAMSVAATSGGYTEIKKDPRWADLVTFEYQSAYERSPTPEEIVKPNAQLEKKALFNLLRQVHAEKAEKLAFLSYLSSDKHPIFLIEDTEIRQTFGRLIGQIAHSHWWSIAEVEKAFGRVVGAPHWCPTEWTVEPLKLACILRVADASHLDARRAPTFLKAISNLSTASEEHWVFQERLNKPYLGEDALVFTSGHAFRLDEAGAWWLCLDTLRGTDRELRSVDALFAERGFPRFAAKRVAGVDMPERFASYVQTDEWLPINAVVHVTDLPGIIQSVGGKELYGQRPDVALRELIQNGSDAVRARRMYEKRNADFGQITVALTETEGEYWLEVTDTGIGMSKRVLTDFLLDFGKSFWGSPQMQEEFPGLLSSGMKPIGKYGIGFFSAFMIAEHVQVATRRSDMGVGDTLVLEFSLGLSSRPILRPATKKEQLLDGGTHVKLKLKIDPHAENGLLFRGDERPTKSLADLCSDLCPALDTDLYAIEKCSERKVLSADDWQYIDGSELLARMKSTDPRFNEDEVDLYRKKAAENLRPLFDSSGNTVGRALITIGHATHQENLIDLSGVVAVGGLKACYLSGICGVLLGQSIKASRNSAKPIVSDEALKIWADVQADLVANLWSDLRHQAACAQYIWMCGGDTKSLPICIYQGNWVSSDEISAIREIPEEIVIIDEFTIDHELKLVGQYVLEPNTIIVRSSGIPGLLQSKDSLHWPRNLMTSFIWGGGPFIVTLGGAVINALSKAWSVPVQSIKDANELNKEKDIKIGTIQNREIHARAIRISKPKY
jgi:hypothetical protein